jgi:hypothetical protein
VPSNGVKVVYCAEPFQNDGSPLSAIVKGIKRAMAGEYSRELSIKTEAGKRRIAAQGFHATGSPGFGLRRMLVDDFGNHVRILERGDRKNPAIGRIVLVPGPPEEVALIHRIFELFIDEQIPCVGIAGKLNRAGYRSGAALWTKNTVRKVLSHEKYIGNVVYGRTSEFLRSPRVKKPESEWLRVEGAFKPVVTPERFAQAHAILREWSPSDEELLDRLRKLYRRKGKLSSRIIDQDKSTPSPAVYRTRFGGLLDAYRMIGYVPPSNDSNGVAARMQQRNLQPVRQPRPRCFPHGPNKPRLINQPGTFMSNEEMISRLRSLYEEAGPLTTAVINRADFVPSTKDYQERFGSLFVAYRLAGYEPPKGREEAIAIRSRNRARRMLRAVQSVSSPARPNETSGRRHDGSNADKKPIVDDDHGHTSA